MNNMNNMKCSHPKHGVDGWTFITNIQPEEAQTYLDAAKAVGIDIAVDDDALDDQSLNVGYLRAILIRNKDGSKIINASEFWKAKYLIDGEQK